MQNFAGKDAIVAASSGDSHQLIAAGLRSLIAQIETSMRLIEAAMAREDNGEEPGSIDVFVLDDVTPRYVTASAALSTCKADLDLALRRLSDSGKLDKAAAARLIA
jgi:hypothetical protein